MFIRSTRLTFILILSQCKVYCTIDINLNELEYLAARLNPFECRRLIAALHYNSYELPNNLSGAERNVDDQIKCIQHLLHWNSSPSEGKGKTHEMLAHRLRQINRNDLADWLGKSAFKQLGKDLDRAMAKPFGELGKEETDVPHPITLEPARRHEDDDTWLQIDVILVATLFGLLATLLILICTTIYRRIMQHYRETKYKKLKQQENQNEQTEMTTKKLPATKSVTKNSNEETDYVHADSDTDTDFE